MKYRAPLLLVLSVLLAACSATGPVRFYSGPPQPKDKLAIIKVPAAITVLSIDGQEVDSPSKISGSYDVQLKPGHHLIEFRYELYWGNNDTGMLIKSKDTGVDAVFEAGKTYAIRYKKPQNADQASNFLTDFPATLVDLSNGKQYSSYVIKNLDEVLAAKKAEANTSNQAPATTASPMPNAETAANADPVKRLKFWWLMANAQQRKQFMGWMKTATESFAPSTDKPSTQTTPPPPADTINGVKLKP